jgi:hypothetical protein
MSNTFSMVNPSFAEELSKDKRFGGGEFRVFHFLIGRMDLNGSVQMSQGDIGVIAEFGKNCTLRLKLFPCND